MTLNLENDVIEHGEIIEVPGGFVVRVGVEAERHTRRNSPTLWHHWRAYRSDGSPVGKHYFMDSRRPVTGKWFMSRKDATVALTETK